MSGRFALFRWTPAFAAQPGFPADQQPHWNLAPGSQVLLLRSEHEQPALVRARWGLTPPSVSYTHLTLPTIYSV